ncbi:MAG: S46 family peptidase, partial [Planctomycetota bacterium]
MSRSDEGMWLLNDPPESLLETRHGFKLTKEWINRARTASVRFNSGGSGAFVSARGLVITNHHVGADTLAKLSTKARDLLKDGFLAKSAADEMACPDLELNMLDGIEDVTGRVEEAVRAASDLAGQSSARRSVMAQIEKESLERTGMRSDVVTLYHGAVYHLYRYRRFTEVKLVFAPESSVAGFGGDVDNFEYPRHGLDFCLFR